MKAIAEISTDLDKFSKRFINNLIQAQKETAEKIQQDATTYISEWPKSKTLTTSYARENVKQLKHSFIHYWWECRVVQPCWKIVWQYFT